MYCEYYKLTFRQAWSPVLKGLVAWQRVPKWRPRGPRFKTTVSGQWSVIFSHISIFSNMMTNPWIAGINCSLNKSALETWMQRSSGGEYGNCKQSDSSVGIEYFIGDSRIEPALIRIWILFSGFSTIQLQIQYMIKFLHHIK